MNTPASFIDSQRIVRSFYTSAGRVRHQPPYRHHHCGKTLPPISQATVCLRCGGVRHPIAGRLVCGTGRAVGRGAARPYHGRLVCGRRRGGYRWASKSGESLRAWILRTRRSGSLPLQGCRCAFGSRTRRSASLPVIKMRAWILRTRRSGSLPWQGRRCALEVGRGAARPYHGRWSVGGGGGGRGGYRWASKSGESLRAWIPRTRRSGSLP
ncbi:hypothetical protein EI77_04485 [Prosthecobacter fusiformis]|uniref:Uncharacterized protein n=1 Tax=Prosthecobacter fusiformis TaxID=48464 RepID=A0A4R7RLX8_9BACT|nr:hypothetical protein EI77_04485 [Prosthecobacter fusiformis]